MNLRYSAWSFGVDVMIFLFGLIVPSNFSRFLIGFLVYVESHAVLVMVNCSLGVSSRNLFLLGWIDSSLGFALFICVGWDCWGCWLGLHIALIKRVNIVLVSICCCSLLIWLSLFFRCVEWLDELWSVWWIISGLIFTFFQLTKKCSTLLCFFLYCFSLVIDEILEHVDMCI